MSLSDAVTLDENIVYSPMKNKPALATQYTSGVTADKPFLIRHLEKINDRNRIKFWYFDHMGVQIDKVTYKYFKAKARRGIALEFVPGW